MKGNEMMTSQSLTAFQLQFEHILKRALELGASDIHIEPFDRETKVRVRVDGTLEDIARISDVRFCARLFEQAKKTCGFDMSKQGESQSERFSNEQLGADFRASLMPVLHGEKIELRVIPHGKTFSLEQAGLPNDAEERLKDALSSWQGLIVTSGPTGSGKTSLLYSMLSHLDAHKNNIMTMEDPVEYTLPNIIHSPINRKKGFDFAEAVRTAMRQDPDVILIGEVRDKETAEAALHAAQTGHLVLTTVHANNSFEVVSRLVGLGLDRDALMENLLLVSAQRLIPKVCPFCAVPDLVAKEKLAARGENTIEPLIGSGCEHCAGKGEKGRALLFEYIHMNAEQRRNNVMTVHRSLSGSARNVLKAGVISYENAASFL